MPVRVLSSSNTPDPSLTKTLLPSPVSSVINRSSSPSSSRSPASTPMLASALPVSGSATPASSARFSNVPSRRLIQSWFSLPSLAT